MKMLDPRPMVACLATALPGWDNYLVDKFTRSLGRGIFAEEDDPIASKLLRTLVGWERHAKDAQ